MHLAVVQASSRVGYGQKHNAGAGTWKEGGVVVGSYSDELGAEAGEGALGIWGEF